MIWVHGSIIVRSTIVRSAKNVDKKYFRRKRNFPLNLVLVVLVKTHLGRHFVTFFFTKSFNNDSQNDSGVDNSGGVSLFFFSRMSQK